MLLNALLLSLIYLVSRTDMINGYMMLTKPIWSAWFWGICKPEF